MERTFNHDLGDPMKCVGVTDAEYDEFAAFVMKRVKITGSKSRVAEDLYKVCTDPEKGELAIRLLALHCAQLYGMLSSPLSALAFMASGEEEHNCAECDENCDGRKEPFKGAQ